MIELSLESIRERFRYILSMWIKTSVYFNLRQRASLTNEKQIICLKTV